MVTRSVITIGNVSGYTAYTPPVEYDVAYLVIGGGGSGSRNAYDDGAGGGAGGYRSSWKEGRRGSANDRNLFHTLSGDNSAPEPHLTVKTGTTYTITVGAGGSNAESWRRAGDSAFGPIIANGGGGGGGHRSRGYDGGSGSGSGGYYASGDVTTGGYGTRGQGSNGGTKTNYPGGGGGGGAGVGGSGGSGNGRAGGNGLQSSITGSVTYRAGGGGGYDGGSGGAGGGGNANGGAGTVNTGGGGGGSKESIGTAGSGGSGIVIIRMKTANYSGTHTGSPTVTTSGSGDEQDTILTFTSSGSYTA